MSLELHDIAEADHRILNPFTDDKLMTLAAAAHVHAGTRILDLACGKGEMLCRWAETIGVTGHGVDISEVFLAAAWARAEELAGTVALLLLLLPAVGPDGVVLIGEPYWTEPLPTGVDLGFPAEKFADLAGTAEKLRAAGLDLVEMVLADGDSWDRYAAAQWWAVDEWLRGHPEHPHRGQVERLLDDARREHLTWQRRCLGRGVFVCRPRP